MSTAVKQARPKNRLFHTIDYVPRVSHFDPRSDYHNFRGFFTLFWIGLSLMVVTTVLRNIKDTGYPLRVRVWSLLTANVWSLGLSDLAMVASSGLVLPFQKAFRNNKRLMRWARGGIVFQSLFEAAWLFLWVNWPFMLQWTWTAQVFFTLHTLTFLMKLHSYAFYNGHLSETERRLSGLDKPGPKSAGDAVVRYPDPHPRRQSIQRHARLGSEHPSLREDLAMELTSPLGNVTYPQNLTFTNYVDYIFCPTLCYELEYPRNKHVQWSELAFKTLGVFGCIFLLTIISEEFIVPVLSEASTNLQVVESASDKALILAETVSMLMFPFLVTFLLVFLVIFEYVLGAFGEITCFADRHFYSDWWNSCDW